MSLRDHIITNHKEIAGSRSKNRLSIQISYAMKLIMEFYSMDYMILMDYIEDVAIIEKPDDPEHIYLFQIKTKSEGRAFTLKTIIEEEWFQKLYNSANKYTDFLSSAAVVCNTEVFDGNKCVFPNSLTYLNDQAINSNAIKIKTAIANKRKITLEEVDLSKFCFVKAHLSTKQHKQDAEYEFESFLNKKEENVQIALARSIFGAIFDRLDEKFNAEINEDCTDIEEIYSNKGVSSDWVKSLIECGVAIQLPDLEKIFNVYEIHNIADMRAYTTEYSRIKMDLLQSSMQIIQIKRTIQELIENESTTFYGNIKDFTELIHERLSNGNLIPQPFSDEYYIKLLIMILAFKFFYRGIRQ